LRRFADIRTSAGFRTASAALTFLSQGHHLRSLPVERFSIPLQARRSLMDAPAPGYPEILTLSLSKGEDFASAVSRPRPSTGSQ
jgi:hypothetical protein